jgi:hypothetical protein
MVCAPTYPPSIRFIQNDRVRLGVDLGKGGAIVYLAPTSDPRNVVNDFDLGRQIQMSFYSGPVPYTPGGKQPAPSWAGLGWNPIQTGDAFGHPSRTMECRFSSHSIYIKCRPMQWPLDDSPGNCTFESWISLDGATVHVRNRLTNLRRDKTQYSARTQELPVRL